MIRGTPYIQSRIDYGYFDTVRLIKKSIRVPSRDENTVGAGGHGDKVTITVTARALGRMSELTGPESRFDHGGGIMRKHRNRGDDPSGDPPGPSPAVCGTGSAARVPPGQVPPEAQQNTANI